MSVGSASRPSWPDNRVVLTGTVAEPPEVRQTPAGLSIVRFWLEHAAPDNEAGRNQPRFRVRIRVDDAALITQARRLEAGAGLRVTGSLRGSDFRGRQQSLEVHARGLQLAIAFNE